MGEKFSQPQQAPERVVELIAARLKRHRSWDWGLALLPLAAALLYVPIFLHAAGFIGLESALLASAAVLAATLLLLVAVAAKSRPARARVARLIDSKVGGKERFLTLATSDPARLPPSLRDRLRAQASGLVQRLNVKVHFPYRVKRSFWLSLAAGIAFLVLFHLFFELYLRAGGRAEALAELAQGLAQDSRLAGFASRLEALLRKLEDPNLKPEEKQSLIEQMRQQIGEEKASQQDRSTKESLERAERALEGLERGSENKGQGEGGGGIGTNLKQDGAGEGKQSKGDGEGRGERAALAQKEKQDGNPMKPSKGEEKEPRQAGKGAGESQKQEPNTRRESEGAERGEMAGKGGKTREGEVPSGPEPERFKRPGEQGDKGLRGAGYVTVELPDEGGGFLKSGRGEGKKAPRRNLSVSNAPLPPATAAGGAQETQHVPLEYRGLIR
ncbi:MAG TPA: hypothetical protein VNL14_13640 [Candidatus Acidoferrales bacterium]|nr:hypothetical protein [Candidatus Acidoferrales bacterium]